METKKDTSTKANEKMTKGQKVIVVLTAVVLTIILIIFATTRYMGDSANYPINTEVSNSETNQTTVNSRKPTDNSGKTEQGGNPSGGFNGGSDHSANQIGGSNEPNKGNQGIGGNDNYVDDSTNIPSDNRIDSSPKPDIPSESKPGQNAKPETDGSIDSQPTEKPDSSGNGTSGIHTGDSVVVTSVGESTITVSVGNETVVIPVQTTVFNGRVTKSGVVSDSLSGYSIGASVMLYYPVGSSLSGVSLSDAYVKADSSRLTISGDYNGDGSKIVFRINGVKLS